MSLVCVSENGYYLVLTINIKIFRHIEKVSKNLDLYSSQYENNIITGDFNVRVSDPHMNDFEMQFD